ncbi:MAG: HD domain-containing protein [Sandaracinus sp.]|nr:HD domain-containing protein [Sandaracinus sp.]
MSSVGIEEELEELASRLLDPYRARIERSGIPEARIINDPVWGSIRLEPWEVALIDSPLLQRLRGIRQLGVVHWVYPSAVHTRFEHSIGAMHCASQILTALERNSGRVGQPLIDDETHKLVRVATLLHDCGHTVFSHAGEHVAEKLPGVDAFRTQIFDELHPRKKPSASEAIAVGLVRTQAFRNLLAARQVGADFVRDVEATCDLIAKLMIGAPAVKGHAFLSLVISGAFDADKLDYMTRDCLMAGVPCAVDVWRTIGKLHCVRVPPGERTELLGPRTGDREPDYRTWARVEHDEDTLVLALPRSATTVLNELAVTRTTLYEKIYFHPKVRALEAMTRRGLEALDITRIAEWFALTDAEVLLRDEFAKLRDRDLPKRSFQIERPQDERFDRAWRRLTRKFDDRSFERDVIEATSQACSSLGINDQGLDVVADRPSVKKVKLDAYAFVGDSYLDLGLASAGEAAQRAEAGKVLARERVYVFASAPIRVATCLATRKVVSKLGFDTSDHVTIPLKLEPKELREASERLEDAGFFGTRNGALSAHVAARMPSRTERHLEDFLRTASSRIQRVAERLGPYQRVDGGRTDVATVATFLRQFETRERARAALRVIEQITFVGRDSLASALRSTLQEREPFDFVCPLGGLADSSGHLAYLMLDLDQNLRVPVSTLEEALRSGADRILLWDDFCGAGGHAKTVLAQWLGQSVEGELDEAHVGPLGDPERLRAATVTIGFARARQEGLFKLGASLPGLGLTKVDVIAAELVEASTGIFEAGSRVLPDAHERDDLRDYLERRMRMALSHKGWPEEKLADRLLGYGNGALLLAFPHNVPTVTLTAIWASSDGWIPLLPRRTKPPRVEAPT